MVERGLSLESLRSRIAKTDAAIARVGVIGKNIKSFLDTDLQEKVSRPGITSTKVLLLAGRNPNEIGHRIQERVIPELASLHEELRQQITLFSGAQEKFERIRQQHAAGEISDYAFNVAQIAFDGMQRQVGIAEVSTQETIPQTTRSSRRKPVEKQDKIDTSQDEDEGRDLPLLRIDIDNKRVEGQPFGVKGNIGWSTAMLFAMNPNQVITAAQIIESGKKAGSRENHAGSLVRDARIALGNPNLIKTLVSRGPNTTYRMEARVEFIPSRMVIDAEKRVIEFRGEKIQLTDFQFVLLDILAKNVDEQMVKSDLATIFEEGASDARINNTFRALKRRLNMPDFPEVAENRKASVGSWYKLSGVEPVWKEIKVKSKSKKSRKLGTKETGEEVEQNTSVFEWEKSPVRSERLKALEWVLDDPNRNLAETIELINYKGRPGRKPTLNSAWLTLSRASEYLILRQRTGIITQDELPTLTKLHKFFTEKDFATAEDFSNYLHDRFFPEEEAVSAESEITDEVTLEQAAVLASLFYIGKDLLDQVGVDSSIVEEIARNLHKKLSHTGKIVENVQDVRLKILKKLSSVKDGGIDTLFHNTNDEDIQLLLLYFSEFTQKGYPVDILLQGSDTYWQEVNAQVVNLWGTFDIEEQVGITPFSGKTEEVPAHDAQLTQEDVRSPFTQPSRIEHVTAIERRDPEVRKKVSEIVSDVMKKIQSEPASLRQVTREYNNLTRSEISNYMGKRYVKPQRGAVPEFTRDEVALMVYARRFGNGLTSRMVKDLKKIISEEISKRTTPE